MKGFVAVLMFRFMMTLSSCISFNSKILLLNKIFLHVILNFIHICKPLFHKKFNEHLFMGKVTKCSSLIKTIFEENNIFNFAPSITHIKIARAIGVLKINVSPGS